MSERGIVFEVNETSLIGIVHEVKAPAKVGVLIVVGGPQTRVGSHRQFVLLARHLAKNDLPVMRFDYSGMGDSEGDAADFLNVSDDIRGAISVCKRELGVEKVVIWGLCDAVSAALIYAKLYPSDELAGMVLLNPWVRSEQGEAKAIVKHYYLNRLKDKAFWRKVVRLEFDFLGSAKSLLSNVKKMSAVSHSSNQHPVSIDINEDNYIEHMLDGLNRLACPILLVISGDDLTASEFLELVKSDAGWRDAYQNKISDRADIVDANHTFSSKEWRNEVEYLTLNWCRQLGN